MLGLLDQLDVEGDLDVPADQHAARFERRRDESARLLGDHVEIVGDGDIRALFEFHVERLTFADGDVGVVEREQARLDQRLQPALGRHLVLRRRGRGGVRAPPGAGGGAGHARRGGSSGVSSGLPRDRQIRGRIHRSVSLQELTRCSP